jgi:hypothetical protein
VATLMPKPAKRCGQTEPRIDIAALKRPREGCSEIADVTLEPVHGRSSFGRAKQGPDPLGQAGEVSCVRTTGGFELAGPLKPLEGVLANRVEHYEPRLGRAIDRPNQALLDQSLDLINCVRRRVDRCDDRFRSLDTPFPDEHSETSKDCLFSSGQEVMAPGDRSPHAALSFGRISWSANKRIQASTEAPEDLAGAEKAGSSGSELDRKG